MDDKGIDHADISPLTEKFFRKATLIISAPQVQKLGQIESDVLKWFQIQGG